MALSANRNRPVGLVGGGILVVIVLLGIGGGILVIDRRWPITPTIIRLSPSSREMTAPSAPANSSPQKARAQSPQSETDRASARRPQVALESPPGATEPVRDPSDSIGSASSEPAAGGGPLPPADDGPAASATPAMAGRSEDEPTYSSADGNVTPPTPLRPELLATLNASRGGIRLDVLTIAIVVNADGTVESVRGLNNPANLAEFILLTDVLSAVKSWSFLPATKDGVPVKYRQVVPVREVVRAP